VNNLIGNPGRLLTAIPDLIYPAFKWGESDYASLQARLDLYDDFLVLSKFRSGQVTEQYLVDPVELTAALAGLSLHSGLLPEGCLFWGKQRGADRLGLYLPPRVWLVTVRDDPSASSGQAPSVGSGQAPPSANSGNVSGQAWRVPLPGLIFTGHGYDYSLWAVKAYPTADTTPLYLAPCPNVQPEGVCRGSAPFPQAGPASLGRAVDVFFSSKFNRDLSNQKSRAFPHCVLDQWRRLHETGAELYPLDDLVETGLTLRRLLHAA
jgi:hypothetical protein